MLREIRRRVDQGHREVVLTGINLGCFRDRAAGYDLPRLVREAGAVPGSRACGSSSIEINHLDEKLVAALRETPTVAGTCTCRCSPATTACCGRCGAATTPRRISAGSSRSDDFNLTTDVIVGFPTEDEAAFARTLDIVERAGITQVHVFPYSPRPGNEDRGRRSVPPQ